MNQVQWIKIREPEIIQLVRYDSIVSAGASTPTVGRGNVERKTTSIEIFIPVRWFVSQMSVYILSIIIEQLFKIFC